MARKLGLRPADFDDHPRRWHYLIGDGKRARALRLGVEEIDWDDFDRILDSRV
jgi:hypothetical protein